MLIKVKLNTFVKNEHLTLFGAPKLKMTQNHLFLFFLLPPKIEASEGLEATDFFFGLNIFFSFSF